MFWNKITVSGEGLIILKSKFLLKFGNYRIDLHKITSPDIPLNYHSHPADAFRIILWGSYVEELEDGSLHRWVPGMMGFIKDMIASFTFIAHYVMSMSL